MLFAFEGRVRVRLRKNWLSPFLSFRSCVHSIVPELAGGAIAGKTTAEPIQKFPLNQETISGLTVNACELRGMALKIKIS